MAAGQVCPLSIQRNAFTWNSLRSRHPAKRRHHGRGASAQADCQALGLLPLEQAR